MKSAFIWLLITSLLVSVFFKIGALVIRFILGIGLVIILFYLAIQYWPLIMERIISFVPA